MTFPNTGGKICAILFSSYWSSSLAGHEAYQGHRVHCGLNRPENNKMAKVTL
jgi:hypothetical protein